MARHHGTAAQPARSLAALQFSSAGAAHEGRTRATPMPPATPKSWVHKLGEIADAGAPHPCAPTPPGTMLFGESTPPAAAERLLGSCLDAGVNFFDAAEMYPVPQRAETFGRSEEVLGAWLKRRRR